MAITLNSTIPVNSTDDTEVDIVYTLVNQPGDNIGLANFASNVTLQDENVSAESLLTGVFAVNSNGTINCYSMKVIDSTDGSILTTDFDFDDDTQWTKSSNATAQPVWVEVVGGDSYYQLAADGGDFCGVYQNYQLVTNRKYSVVIDAQVPAGTILRIDDRHFTSLQNTDMDPAHYKDFIGDGTRKLFTFDFRPARGVQIAPGSTVDARINGGKDSLDWGRNMVADNEQRMQNKMVVEHPVQIRAEDSSGSVTTETFLIKSTVPWRRITTLTHGYVLGGYKGSESWRTVTRITNSTDTSINVTTMSGSGNAVGNRYTDGSTDQWTGQVMSHASNAFGESNKTENYNMVTETPYAIIAQHSWNRFGGQSASDYHRRTGYHHGGSNSGTTVEKFDLVTGTKVGNLSSAHTAWTYHGGGFTETHMYYAQAGSGTTDYTAFATETRVGNGFSVAANFQSGTSHTKAISMWDNRGWYVGYNTVVTTWQVNFTTGTMAQSASQTTNNGEGNCTTGDNHGYQCGGYNGAQNNHCDRFDFVTNTIARAANADNKGTPGASSGVASWCEL